MTQTMTAGSAMGTSAFKPSRPAAATTGCARPLASKPTVKRTSCKRAHRRHRTQRGLKRIPAGFWIALVSWVLAIAFMTGNLNETFSLADQPPQVMHVQVEKGDTLWEIAQELNQTVFQHKHDLRYLIYVIEEANGLKSAVIHPGQTLVVPLDL